MIFLSTTPCLVRRDRNGLTPLLVAVGLGRLRIAVLLLSNAASSLPTNDEDHFTPLHLAAYNSAYL